MLAKSGLPALPKKGDAITAEQMQRIELDIIASLDSFDNIDELDDGRRRLKAIEGYLRSPEMQKPALGAQRHIEARIGQLLPNQQGKPFSRDEKVQDIDVATQSDFRLLARGLEELDTDFKEWRRSRRALLADFRFRLGLMPETPVLPAGKFACIVADPPWQQDTGPDAFGTSGEGGHDALAYRQMSVASICDLADKNGKSVKECFADDAHLYLWTINKYVEASYAVARAWGFKPSVLLTWAKPQRGVGLGDTFRLTSEFILFCRKGKLPHRKIVPTTWFDWPRGKHSEKPDGSFKLIESVTPGPYLELFSRSKRKNWIVWGDEAGGD